MEDNDETTNETLASDSPPPSTPPADGGAAVASQMKMEAQDTPLPELAGDVAADRVSELGDSQVISVERERESPVDGGQAAGDAADRVSESVVGAEKERERSDSGSVGDVDGSDVVGDVADRVVGVENERERPPAGGDVAGDVADRVLELSDNLVDGEEEGPASVLDGSRSDGYGGDVAGTGLEIKPEVKGVEPDLGIFETESGLIPGNGCLEVVDGGFLMGSEMNGKGDGALGSVSHSDELQQVDEMEKLTFGDEMDREDEVTDEVLMGSENAGDLGVDEPVTCDDDVIGGREMKSAEEGATGSVPSLDEVKPADEAARQNLPIETETAAETGLEGEKGGVQMDSPVLDKSEAVEVKSPVADDVAREGEFPTVDTEVEVEKEVGEEVQVGDAMVGEKDDSRMVLDNEVKNEDSPQLDNAENVGAEGLARDEDEDEAMVEEYENLVDMGMETEETDMTEVAEEETEVSGGKRKRGKNSRVPSKAPARKVIEEDVCFICFDGGDLVLCDRRGCPKAYHPSCVNRDEAFFRAKGRWNCGWHQCNICEKKNAYYMCYTCTFSLCKACIKDAVIYCVRDNKGFCEACMKTVSLIENNEERSNEEQLDFDDKSSWLYLFKDYWSSLKQKLSLSSAEIAKAKHPAKGSDALSGKRESPEEAVDGSNHQDSSPDSEENLEGNKNKRRKTKKTLKPCAKEVNSPSSKKDSPPARKLKRNSTFGTEVTLKPESSEWASKELLEFVMHMKNGDRSAISQFDVQALLLAYIKTNNLRDPRRKSQIICDARLQSLFGKPRVGHFEMLKLLESHFLIKEDPLLDDNQGTVVDDESNDLDADGPVDTSSKWVKDKKRKTRKKGHNRERQSNLDDYAAIDIHNIGLIFLRRKLVEDLLEDDERFCDKVVGTFVRIRISASTQKQDMYRLVQVLGTSKAAEPYKVGKRTTDLMLEILNLNKKELVSIDTISNQEFSEEECKRLRQSIKCGLTSRLTVGGILDKATEIQAARVSDWLESEIVRVSHLRDRASEKGRRKELRECVEKLQLLKTPEERWRRLDEVPEVHADPNMDPDHESEEHDSEEDSKQDPFTKPRGSVLSRRGREPISPRGANFSSVDSWSGLRQNSGKNYEVTRNLSNIDFSNKNDESASMGGIPFEGARGSIGTQQATMEKVMSPIKSVNAGQGSLSFARSESFAGAALENPQPSLPAVVSENAIKINESEKMWHYKDPAGKVQGPFSIVQLRKWSKNGYFPADLQIWKTTETEDDSILLTDALEGKFQKHLVQLKTNPSPAHTVLSDQNIGSHSQIGTSSSNAWGSLSVEVPDHQANKSNDSFNPPSPTPNTITPVWNTEQSSETLHSASSVTVQTANFAPAKQSGNQENISPSSLLNSARQLMNGFENGSINSLGSSTPVGPTITQPTSVPNETPGWGTQQIVVPNQTAVNDPQTQNTVGATNQNLDPNSSYSMPIQQQAGYNPWGGVVPTTVQTPSGSYPMPGYAAMPQPDQWRQPVPGNQPTFPTQVPPNAPWGMGMVQANPNMGWGMGMVQANPNMGWTPMVNPGWVPTAGNPGAMVPVMPPAGNANQGWAAQQVNQGGSSVPQGPPPGNMNSGWGPPPRTPGTNTQVPAPVPGNVNQGWGTGTPPSNPKSGKGNSGGWGTPSGNSGGRGNESHRGGNRFSGPRDRVVGQDGRPFRPKAYDNHGNRICPYFLEGHCKKGSRCDMVHQNLPDMM